MKEIMKVVKAKSVEDYLDKYYKKSRYKERGKEYEKVLLKSYKEEFARRGFVCTSHHENVTGEMIAWPYYPGNKTKNEEDTGGGCSVCGQSPAVNIQGTYWLCGPCAFERIGIKEVGE